jgi:quinol monooxygenase YgiN
MITVLARLKARPGMESLLAEECMALAREVREKEKGCLMYIPHVSKENPAEIIFFEKYTDQEALQTHMKSPYFTAVAVKFHEILEGQPVIQILKELG